MRRSCHLLCLVAPALGLLLFQSACSDDPDDSTVYPKVTLSQDKVWIAAGETVTVTATFQDFFGKRYPADWSITSPTRELADPTLSSWNGPTTVVSLTASPTLYEPLLESPLAGGPKDPVVVELAARPVDSKIPGDKETINVVLKPIYVASAAQTVSVGPDVVRGKCTFMIKNDRTSDAYQWDVVRLERGITTVTAGSRTKIAFEQSATIDAPVVAGHSAEFNWTQPKAPFASTGFVSFTMVVKARSAKSPELFGTCRPSAAVLPMK